MNNYYKKIIENYSIKTFLSSLVIVFFYFSLKVIKYRIDILYKKYKINEFFIKIFGKINILNTILIIIILYSIYYFGKAVIYNIFNKEVDHQGNIITNLF